MQKETMPLYTYVMSYDGRTKVFQDRSSNYTGFLLAPISSSFPELKPAFGDLVRMTPKPVPGVAKAWGCTLDISGKPFNLHVVETREK
ncbi:MULTISPECIES: hypothetical protein [Sphingomonas]|uniref:Uncharacterized protein n=1 Tax=Sphingomonas trueperi TaxID=53317 RepID=A0A7X6BBT0_9SPHN|nr:MULTISPECIES: hypothetical protein [Sphingomonas]NJB96525.1 hypothetical protein [Sphingomonas trueperi]